MNTCNYPILLKEGLIIEGPFWTEPVMIKRVEMISNFTQIFGYTIYSNAPVDRLFSEEDLKSLTIKEAVLDFSGSGLDAFLSIESIRYSNASLFDPLLAVNVSKIDPLPFQLEAVYSYILKLPKIRFLIADDPGAGKTIMTGLIIKELKLRKLASRILIVVPGHLKDQWRREMKEKFNEVFIVLDRSIFESHYGINPWEKEYQVITSIDFAKQEDIMRTLNSVHWDLCVVDEAHKMAAYKYGDKLEKTERYKLGEILSKTSNHLLFLTATPHKGDPENFRLFLDLLNPGFFSNKELIEESLENKDNPLFIRRLKEDLKDFDGKPLFTNRYIKTVKFYLSDEEKLLYNKLSEYVVNQFNLAIEKEKNRNVAFALLILQRRMASSTYALKESLTRRKNKLQELLQYSEESKRLQVNNFDEIEDLDEEERWKEESKWETISLAKTKEELSKEINTLVELISLADKILSEESEKKLSELKVVISQGLEKIKEMNGNPKILIFTESRDTMEYLVKKVRSWGYSVCFIHGGMKLEDRIAAEKEFKHNSQVMVATEAAGEGINLQFCHLMINYDIPWNPNRLEQRMGRIHRYGQQKDVHIFNLIASDTLEGEILSKMFDKLEEIRNSLGTDKVFDVIGDVFYGKRLYELIVEAIAQTRSLDDIIKEIDFPIDENYKSKLKEVLGESLATKFIDYTRIKELGEKAKELRLNPEYLERFFTLTFDKLGGRYRYTRDGFIAIDLVPYELRLIADRFDFQLRFGSILKQYSKATFDKELAFKNPDVEFISFGHPLFEALLEWVEKNLSRSLQQGSVFLDPSNKWNGIVWFFEVEIRDGKNNVAGRRIFAVYDDGNENNEPQEIPPTIIWDLKPLENSNNFVPNFPISYESSQKRSLSYLLSTVENYRKEILSERKRQAEIKKKYGIRSLDLLISELDATLTVYEESSTKEKNYESQIQNLRERKGTYEKAKESLIEEIKYESSLSIASPRLRGAIFVLPLNPTLMANDTEVEQIGMEIAMQYEKSQGRNPIDVSKENLGYDIKSIGETETRYIEVKARSFEGEIALTPNEWIKAKRFKNQYWLYVVSDALVNPTLYIINNPTEKLIFKEISEIVRFVISNDEWKSKGTKV